MADIDQVSNQLQSMKNVLRQFKTASNAAGAQPDKLDKLRSQWTTIEAKVSNNLSGAMGRDWEPLKRDFKQLREEFQKADRGAQAKQSAAAAAEHERAATDSDPIGGGGGVGAKMGLGHGVAVNMAPLDTEEALQRERLQGVVEIEGQMGELKSIYSDFNSMVNEQQTGLNTIESRVDVAQTKVESGVKHLQGASAVQKSSRKWMCCIIVIVVLLVVGGVIAAVVVTQSK